MKDLNPAFIRSGACSQGNPLLQESLLLGAGGRRTVSKIGPTYVYNTVDHPIFPTTGKRLTRSFDLAGLGGNTKFINPRVEGIAYFQHTQAHLARLPRAGRVHHARTATPIALPIFEKLFLGGEYSIRGFDLRTVGPRDHVSGVVIGGNKSLLFNAEYLINIAGPVRLVLFADAGQVRDVGENFAWKEPIYQTRFPPPTEHHADRPVRDRRAARPARRSARSCRSGSSSASFSAFKSSIGAEIRFFMPVLNVPFRLIFAMNPSRGGVLDNQLQPEKKYKFRFAVGSTF